MIERSGTKRFHVAVSVNVDRRDDRYLRESWLEDFRAAGLATSVAGIRKACAEARARGLEVFPPCNEVDERGRCVGHADPLEQSIAEVP